MILFILILLLIAVLVAWYGMWRTSLCFFIVSLILAVACFFHHITDMIGLSL